ncbi:hypothetical protein ACJX0J_009272, partial [Zea mays]
MSNLIQNTDSLGVVPNLAFVQAISGLFLRVPLFGLAFLNDYIGHWLLNTKTNIEMVRDLFLFQWI